MVETNGRDCRFTAPQLRLVRRNRRELESRIVHIREQLEGSEEVEGRGGGKENPKAEWSGKLRRILPVEPPSSTFSGLTRHP